MIIYQLFLTPVGNFNGDFPSFPFLFFYLHYSYPLLYYSFPLLPLKFFPSHFVKLF